VNENTLSLALAQVLLSYCYLEGKLRKLQKLQKIWKLSESCREVILEGSGRAGKEEGPEAGRKRAGDFADGPYASVRYVT